MRRFFAVIIAVLHIVPVAWAQQRPSTTNYYIPTDVQSVGGGEEATSDNYILDDTIGEANIGESESDNYRLDAGYRQTTQSFISLACDDTAQLGTIVATGRADTSIDCTVIADGDAGYAMSWRSGLPTDNLVGHWKLDESSGTTSNDSSVYDNDGTVTDAAVSTDVFSPHHSVRSRDFDGDDSILISDAPELDVSRITFAAWFNVDTLDAPRKYIGGKWGNGARSFQLQITAAGTLDGVISNTGGNDANSSVSTSAAGLVGSWHHAALTFDGTTIRLYLDGNLVDSEVPGYSTIYAGATNFGIGTVFFNGPTTPLDPWKGLLDDVRLYDEALTQSEIQQLATKKPVIDMAMSGSSIHHIPAYYYPSTGGLIGHWKMDETTAGASVLDWSGRVKDATPSGTSGANNNPQPSTDVPDANFETARSLDFDGTDDVVTTTDTSASNLTGNFTFDDAENFTLSIWYKGTDTAQNSDWGKGLMGRNNSDLYAGLVIRSGLAEYIHYDSSWQHNIKSTTSVADGEWHHIVYVNHSDRTGDLYIDGVQEIDGLSSAISDANRRFKVSHLMSNYNNVYTTGKIDDARVYNRALSAVEVAALYGVPQSWSVPSNQSYWGARLTSGSDDTDAKWGTDNSSEKWLHVGDGDYPVVSRATRTDTDGSDLTFDFRAEIGAAKVQRPGAYHRTIVLTASSL